MMAEMPGIDLREAEQLALATKLGPRWGATVGMARRFTPANSMYGLADAAVYASMLDHLRPRRILEVGSGHSSVLALDVAEALDLDLSLTCIEPHPERLLGQLGSADRDRIRLLQQPVQSAPLEIFDELGPGDICFIDSSHVAKAGSDVNWLFFQVLPRLRTGVAVHVHDIFHPFEYLPDWIETGRSFNEAYLLRAFLTFNDRYEITLFSSWLWNEHPEVVAEHLPDAAEEQPGSIWITRTS
jgi:hypothetical protein